MKRFLGATDAHYTAATVELREYVKANPKDKAAKGLLHDMAHGKLHIHTHDAPPPSETTGR